MKDVTFEWYLRTFYNKDTEEMGDDQLDKYRTEFEIWKESSSKEKAQMWPY